MVDTGRVYAGRSEEQRRADRRGRLVAAGLELFARDGWAGATIEHLCAEASVATRSFYEEFSSRDALLAAVYQQVMAQVIDDVLPRVAACDGSPVDKIRVGLQGYVDYLTNDPRRCKVVHREVRAAGVLEGERQAMLLRFADIILAETRMADTAKGRTLALALAGGVAEVLVDWVAQPEPRPDTGPIVEGLLVLYVAAITPRQA